MWWRHAHVLYEQKGTMVYVTLNRIMVQAMSVENEVRVLVTLLGGHEGIQCNRWTLGLP